jgi:N-acyl homoserine lactone hydrolase
MELPTRLYLMQLGTSFIPTKPHASPGSAGCYLIQMDDARNILVDSGLPPDYVQPPGSPPIENTKDVLTHLTELGLQPRDIDFVICTHFDVDHVGHHDAFARAEFIVQRKHYELARSGHPRFDGARIHWDDPRLRYRLVDGDTELLPGITLIETSGHAVGHQSVLVRLPKTGNVLLAGDAVVLENYFTMDRMAWPFEDEESLRASTRKLIDLVASEHVELVVFGHDGRQWQTLTKAPDYFE